MANINRIRGEFNAGMGPNGPNSSDSDPDLFLQLLKDEMSPEVESVPLGEGVDQTVGVGSVNHSFHVHPMQDPETYVSGEQVRDINSTVENAFE